MSINYTVNTRQRIIITSASGDISLSDMQEHMQTVQNHPEIQPDYNHIFDLRKAGNFEITTSDVKQLAEFSYFNEQSKRAIVASSDLFYGMSRMYEIFKKDASVNVRVFRTYEEAKQWVGYQDETEAPSSRAG
jgi:hypothetical protein